MDPSEQTDLRRTRLIKRIALISVITLLVLLVIAAGIYVVAFVILSPMAG